MTSTLLPSQYHAHARDLSRAEAAVIIDAALHGNTRLRPSHIYHRRSKRPHRIHSCTASPAACRAPIS
jgi:hypothetical protein